MSSVNSKINGLLEVTAQALSESPQSMISPSLLILLKIRSEITVKTVTMVARAQALPSVPFPTALYTATLRV